MKPHRLSPAERKAKRQARHVPCSHNGRALVDHTRLAPNNSWSSPEFMQRGYYQDKAFSCCDCGEKQVWTATQQKWWYEIARGDVFTEASRCRKCRRVERERRHEARRVHLEGLAAKQTKSNSAPR